VLADPLRATRTAIERRLPARKGRPRLLVTGAGRVADVARERARALASDKDGVLILALQSGSQGLTASITGGDGAAPQSLNFALDSAKERAGLFDYLRQARLARIELADPLHIPPFLAEGLIGLGAPHDLLIADDGLREVQDPDKFTPGSSASATRLWGRIAKSAANILAPTEDAEAFASRFLPKRQVIRLSAPRSSKRRASRPRRKTRDQTLGIIPLGASAQDYQLLQNLVRSLADEHSDLQIVVFGGTLNDLGLMRSDNVFVTGPVTATELADAIRFYQVQSLLLCGARPLFGHPLQNAALESGLPLASFDWVSGQRKAAKSGLALDPRASAGTLAGAVGQWMAGR